jgi:hypothetical protein
MPVDSLLALVAFLALVLAWIALPGTGRIEAGVTSAPTPVPAGVVPA